MSGRLTLGHVERGWVLRMYAHAPLTCGMRDVLPSPRYNPLERRFVRSRVAKVAARPTMYVNPSGVVKMAPGIEIKERR